MSTVLDALGTCYQAELRERKREAQQAEQQGKQTIEHMFAAAAAKKQKQQEGDARRWPERQLTVYPSSAERYRDNQQRLCLLTQ